MIKRVRWAGATIGVTCSLSGAVLLVCLAALALASGRESASRDGAHGGSAAAFGFQDVTASQSVAPFRPARNPLRNAYFDDLHVHTSYSLDAYSFGNRNDPRAAYRYGHGEAVVLPSGVRNQLRVPLDFMAATDHDLWLGETNLCQDPAYNSSICRDLRVAPQDYRASTDDFIRTIVPEYFGDPSARNADICGNSQVGEKTKCFERARSMWLQIKKNADEFYEPGVFTTFAGFEWTSGFQPFGMMHRNVIFRGRPIAPLLRAGFRESDLPVEYVRCHRYEVRATGRIPGYRSGACLELADLVYAGSALSYRLKQSGFKPQRGGAFSPAVPTPSTYAYRPPRRANEREVV